MHGTVNRGSPFVAVELVKQVEAPALLAEPHALIVAHDRADLQVELADLVPLVVLLQVPQLRIAALDLRLRGRCCAASFAPGDCSRVSTWGSSSSHGRMLTMIPDARCTALMPQKRTARPGAVSNSMTDWVLRHSQS
jgi:hypothetical protein